METQFLHDYLTHLAEEYGRMLNADPSKVSMRAKKRGLPQLGTLGAGNHYCEIQVQIVNQLPALHVLPITFGTTRNAVFFNLHSDNRICLLLFFAFSCLDHQVVEEVYDEFAAKKMGIEQKGQVQPQ